jgi:hypothetical protein
MLFRVHNIIKIQLMLSNTREMIDTFVVYFHALFHQELKNVLKKIPRSGFEPLT